ncbi:uncharacterized protein LOC135575505 [Columba livia]|uniref:uncharacterized protein LOC135575505 n=1 Tax=Columba livia TaxID=8932 RepID=UPI0031B9CD08
MMNLENNDVCPIVASVLNVFRVFPVSSCGAELHTHLQTIKKPFCGEGKTHTKETHPCVNFSEWAACCDYGRILRVSTTGTGVYCSSGEGPTTTQINRKTGCQSHWDIICWYLKPRAGEGPREAPAAERTWHKCSDASLPCQGAQRSVPAHRALTVCRCTVRRTRCGSSRAPLLGPRSGYAPWRLRLVTPLGGEGRGGALAARVWHCACSRRPCREGVPPGAERGVERTARFGLRLLHTQRRRLLQRRGRTGPGGSSGGGLAAGGAAGGAAGAKPPVPGRGGGAAALPSPCGAYPPVRCAGRFAGAGTAPLL